MENHLPLLVCVDDEIEVLNALHRVFRSSFEVHSFESPALALSFIKSSPKVIPVIISDFKMALVNGIDFLNEVKNISPSTIRVILSGQMEIEDLSLSINQQIIHKFFLKPWDNQVLKLQIQEALQTHYLVQEKNKYKKLSITDPTTQLTNHRFFQEQIRKDLSNSHSKNPVSLLMIDVDHFKSYNDSYGHPEGDKLLRAIADRLTECLNNPSFSLSRYGGEEFGVILPNTNKKEAVLLAQKICHNFSSLSFFSDSDHKTNVTLSIGVSTSPSDTSIASELIELADKALYQAKNNGRNQVQMSS